VPILSRCQAIFHLLFEKYFIYIYNYLGHNYLPEKPESGALFETIRQMEGNMTTEQNTIVKALQMAIQMEIDGKEYYLKASQKSRNELGKKLLQSLADEEDIHREKFTEIYNAIRGKRAWPATDFRPDRGKRLRTVFAQALGRIGSNAQALATELDAVQTAMSMENKTFDFYNGRSKEASCDAEREFYHALAAQERTHHEVLLDYYEYLKDPAGWFVKKEHPSLEG
jgi:rubrerythrin